MNSMEEIRAAAAPFVERADAFAQKSGLAGKATADHIGYKCASTDSFERLRTIFENESAYVYQSLISNRRIAIIRLREPIMSMLGPIYYFELSDQKPDRSQAEGFDHLEVFPNDGSFEGLVSHVQSHGETGERSAKAHHTTHNFRLGDDFILKIEPAALIEKIRGEEMV